MALVLFEKEIVVAGGVERRIEINKIGDFIGNSFVDALAPKPNKIVASVELVHEFGRQDAIMDA